MMMLALVSLLSLQAPAAPDASAEPVFHDGNFVGWRFSALPDQKTVQRVDNISLLCVDGIDRARRRLRASGAPVTSPQGQSTSIEAAPAAKVADALDAIAATRRADIEELGVQLTYNQKSKRARVTSLCEGGLFETMGLKRDDLVLFVGDRRVAGRESAAVALKYLDEAPAPPLRVRRNSEEIALSTKGHERAVRALLVVMSKTLAMVPDPAEPGSLTVEPPGPPHAP